MSQFSTASIPALPLLGLSESERSVIMLCQREAMRCRYEMQLAEAYYLGEQIVKNLRIAVPKELEFLRTIVGWAGIAVDPLVERLGIDGFRLPNATDSDERLVEVWDGNGLDSEQTLSYTDAFSMGSSYWSVGSPLESGGIPQITVESPLNMSVLWDLRGTSATAAFQEYWNAGRRHAVLQVPRKNIYLATDDNGQWVIDDRDEHGFDFVGVERVANRSRTNNRNGSSEITLPLRSVIDAACRTLLGLEVAREIYSVPQKMILGASESDFQKSDGTRKSAWDTYITKVLALERDADGNLPELKQMQAYDPSVFTKLIEMYASQAAGILSANPQDLGLYTQGNPTSAEAGIVTESRRDRRAVMKQAMFGVPMVKVMQHAMRFQNNGVLPQEFARMAVDWRPVNQEPISIASDALSKQIASGSVPATSDVVLKRLGYSAVERRRLEQDRKRDLGATAIKSIADSLNAPDGNPANL